MSLGAPFPGRLILERGGGPADLNLRPGQRASVALTGIATALPAVDRLAERGRRRVAALGDRRRLGDQIATCSASSSAAAAGRSAPHACRSSHHYLCSAFGYLYRGSRAGSRRPRGTTLQASPPPGERQWALSAGDATGPRYRRRHRGGPAGLTAAYELTKLARRPIVLEKHHRVGGLARTENYKGFHFDMGPPLLHQGEAVKTMWREVLAGEILRRPVSHASTIGRRSSTIR